MESAIRIQVLDESVCDLFHARALKKDLNQSVSLPSLGKQLGRLGSFAWVRELV